MRPGARGAVGLLGARPALDDRVDGLQVARVRDERDGDLAGRRLVHALGAEVVLHVARAAFGTADHGVDRPLALELAQDLLVGLADRVREHVQPAAVRHSDHDLVGASVCGQLDRLVEHRHHHVEPLGGELLLAEEGLAEVVLERLGARQPLEQRALLVGAQRLAVLARLDHAAQPDALLVVGDVLELVGDRAAVGLDEMRQRLGQRLARHVEAERGRGDPGLQLGGQRRLGPVGLERWVADRLGAERIEPGGEVAVHPVGLDQLRRRAHSAQELLVDLCGRGLGLGSHDRRGTVAVAVRPQRLEQPRQPRVRGDQLAVSALEQPAPLLRDRAGVLEVFLEQRLRVARVQPVDVVHRSTCSSTGGRAPVARPGAATRASGR